MLLRASELFLLLLISVSMISCVVYSKPTETEKTQKKHDMIACEKPRPQICTREYRPVCALQDNGSYKTYATGCTACSNERVVSYYKGVCD